MILEIMPLKFRVWDTNKKRFTATDLEIVKLVSFLRNNYWSINGEYKDIIVSQDTGLIDSSEDEIYTGDILKVGRGNVEEIGVVEYSNGFLGLRTAPHHIPITSWLSVDEMNELGNWRKVGNIWENKKELNWSKYESQDY